LLRRKISDASSAGVPDTDGMKTSEQWIGAIEDACAEPDPARCNRLITRLHHLLSEALADGLGRESGANFHSWAVWGSRKAGVTIRQENLDSAISTATVTAGVVGCAIGAATGVIVGRGLGWSPDYFTLAIGAAIGLLIGGWLGRQIAIWSRGKAAKLMLRGNQIVIQDIGEQSARFLELLENRATGEGRQAFFAGLRAGPTERHGQDRLATAFRFYLAAFDSIDLEAKRAAMIAGNCEIVYHEHIRLDVYIRGAMPIILRRCATRRWMTYQIGERVLTVSEDLPGIPTPTAARNWAKIEERMRYVFALFRRFHDAPEVFSTPYPEMEMVSMGKPGHSPV
jgi:Glycine zipper